MAQSGQNNFPNAVHDEQEYVKFLSGAQLSNQGGSDGSKDSGRIATLEADNKQLKNTVQSLVQRVAELEKKFGGMSTSGAEPPKSQKEAAGGDDDDDDDVDLFGSDDDEQDAEAERVRAERLKAYEAKKSKKPALVAKSNIILDVKPWDDETDMAEMERKVRSINADGLLWGSSKLVPLAYGIKKLQIACVVEDDKVGTDFLEEEITSFEDFVQSVDIAAFQKI